jgi:hypothetical protein
MNKPLFFIGSSPSMAEKIPNHDNPADGVMVSINALERRSSSKFKYSGKWILGENLQIYLKWRITKPISVLIPLANILTVPCLTTWSFVLGAVDHLAILLLLLNQ